MKYNFVYEYHFLFIAFSLVPWAWLQPQYFTAPFQLCTSWVCSCPVHNLLFSLDKSHVDFRCIAEAFLCCACPTYKCRSKYRVQYCNSNTKWTKYVTQYYTRILRNNCSTGIKVKFIGGSVVKEQKPLKCTTLPKESLESLYRNMCNVYVCVSPHVCVH